jgi:hypothetical protein
MGDLLAFVMLATPVLIGLSWRARQKHGMKSPRLRAGALLAALIAVSINAAIYYCWLAYRLLAGGSDLTWSMRGFLADNVTVYLAGVSILLAAIGKGSPRILVVTAALCELVLWSNFGVL